MNHLIQEHAPVRVSSSEVISWVAEWSVMSGELHSHFHMYFRVWDEGSRGDEML